MSKNSHEAPVPITRADAPLTLSAHSAPASKVGSHLDIDIGLVSRDEDKHVGHVADREDGKAAVAVDDLHVQRSDEVEEESNLDVVVNNLEKEQVDERIDEKQDEEDDKEASENGELMDETEPSNDISGKPGSIDMDVPFSTPAFEKARIDQTAGAPKKTSEGPMDTIVPEQSVTISAGEPVLTTDVDTASTDLTPTSPRSSNIPRFSGDKASSASKLPKMHHTQSPRYTSREQTGIPQFGGKTHI